MKTNKITKGEFFDTAPSDSEGKDIIYNITDCLFSDKEECLRHSENGDVIYKIKITVEKVGVARTIISNE